MVNKYKRKSQQGSWSEAAMKAALRDVTNFKKSIKKTAAKFNIPRATLQRHLKSGSYKKKLGRFTSVFTEEQEQELLNYVFEMDTVFYGLSKDEFLQLVYQFAEKNHIPHPFKDGSAGNDWYRGFVQRHPDVTLRKPEPTSIARARGFNKPQVYRFFDLLEEQISKHDIDATRIYNMDETGVQTSSNKPPRVLTKTGKRQVGIIASTERGRTTTVICCCNAAGSFIPPFMIFARKKMNSRLLDGAAPGTQGTCTDNGWVNGPAFLEWLRFFIETVRPTSDKKVILVLDNHESHKYLHALEFASANNVIFISLAPHTTHRMQPLDYCVYGPLKTYFEQEVASFQKAHAGRIINQNDIASLFAGAYMKAATAHNAINGFKTTGLYPTNRYIFDESDFLPATVTERPLEATSQVVTAPIRTPSPSIIADNMSQTGVVSTPPNIPIIDTDPDRTPSPSVIDELILSQMSTSLSTKPVAHVVQSDAAENVTAAILADEVAPIEDTWMQNTLTTPIKEVPSSVRRDTVPTVDLDFGPSTSTAHVSPMMIRPIPKVSPKKSNKQRKTQKAQILTSTPIKDEQRQKLLKKMPKIKKTLSKENRKKQRKTKIEKVTQKDKGNRRSKSSVENYPCLVCNEPYLDPPTEDWIQCDDCKRWAHDQCTSYIGVGAYYCDDCQEI